MDRLEVPLLTRSMLMLLALCLLMCSSLPGGPAGNGEVQLIDITAESKITFNHTSAPEKKFVVESMSGGLAMFDYDKDGWMDLYFVDSPIVGSDPAAARSELWRNNGNGTFTDVTDKAGVGKVGWGMGVCAGDYNNDGWEDLYVTCFGPNHLFKNNGDGTFTDVITQSGADDDRWSCGAAFGDYDNDGWLDLFVSNYVDYKLENLPEFGKGKMCQYRGVAVQCGPRGLPGAGDSLFRNNGDGTFTNVTKAAGVADDAGRYGLGVLWCDFNEDSLIDLYVANDAGPNFLYRNNGNGTFSEIGFMSGVAVSEDGGEQGSMGLAIGDYEHKGRWNIMVTNFSEEYNAVYRQEKEFLFTDVSFATQTAQVSFPFVCWGLKFFDYDNDGWQDLFITAGHVYPQMENARIGTTYKQRKLFFKNNRNGTFTEIAASIGPSLMVPAPARGAAFGDMDNDGDVDIAVNNIDGPALILRNEGGNRNNWISIGLIGTSGNPDAYGARVKVTSGDLVQIDECRSGGGYISQHDKRLHFGLQKRTMVDTIEVRWPKGRTETFSNIPANSFVTLKEGAAAPEINTSRR
jgi:hypothetical protein